MIPEKRGFTEDDRALNADENGHFPGECCPVRKMWIEPKGMIHFVAFFIHPSLLEALRDELPTLINLFVSPCLSSVQ